MKIGILFRLSACWVGVHYSKHHRRFCINLLPFITVWVTKPGGVVPFAVNDEPDWDNIAQEQEDAQHIGLTPYD